MRDAQQALSGRYGDAEHGEEFEEVDRREADEQDRDRGIAESDQQLAANPALKSSRS